MIMAVSQQHGDEDNLFFVTEQQDSNALQQSGLYLREHLNET
jgi:hypothetical protein